MPVTSYLKREFLYDILIKFGVPEMLVKLINICFYISFKGKI